MSYPDLNVDDMNKKLTHVYVALAMTRRLAQSSGPNEAMIRSIDSLVEVASTILEEILATQPEAISPWPIVHESVDLVM